MNEDTVNRAEPEPGSAHVEPPPEARSPIRVRPRNLGLRPGIDPDSFNQLVDELEVEEFIRKYQAECAAYADTGQKPSFSSSAPADQPT